MVDAVRLTGDALNAEVARRIFGHARLGYDGPPADPSVPWQHEQSVLYPTPDAAIEAYRRYYTTRQEAGENMRGKATPDDMGTNLCYWQDGWGPIMVDDYAECIGDAMSLIEAWDGDVSIRRHNGMWNVGLFRPSEQWDAWAETLPLAICYARLKTS